MSGPPTLDSLTDEELIGLRQVFRRLLDQAIGGTASGTRVAAACLNEVDARLSARGRLNMRTGVLT